MGGFDDERYSSVAHPLHARSAVNEPSSKGEVDQNQVDNWLAVPLESGVIASAVVLFLVQVLLTEWSYRFVFPPSPSAVFWLPSGVSFALFVWARHRPRLWPHWLLAVGLAEAWVVTRRGVPPGVAAAWAVSAMLLPLNTVIWSRRFAQTAWNLSRIRGVLMLYVVLIPCVVPGALLAAAAGAAWGADERRYWEWAVSWAASDALGIVLVAPVLMSWGGRPTRIVGGAREATALVLSLLLCVALVYRLPVSESFDRALFSFLLLFVAWAAIRFGARGASLVLLFLDLVAVYGILESRGPLAGVPLNTEFQVLGLQVFVANLGLILLLLAAAIDEQRGARLTAEQALELRDRFLSIASHELRTPLTSLGLQVGLLRRSLSQSGGREMPREKLLKLAEIADRQVQRLGALVGELLDVSRLRQGRLMLRPEEFDLVELVDGVLERLSLELQRRAIPASRESYGPVIGVWDRSRLDQVVMNLLSNALKYGQERPIEVSVRREGDEAVLLVRDQGIGISAEDQSRIFDRFERAVPSHSFSGLGLGLFIVKRLVVAHGGSVSVRSAPGRGSTFVVRLPLRAAEAPVSLSLSA